MKYAIFKPREYDRNFLFAVILLTVKMLFFVDVADASDADYRVYPEG